MDRQVGFRFRPPIQRELDEDEWEFFRFRIGI